MISRTLQIMMLLAVAVYFALLLLLLKKRSLHLKYTLLWILSGVLMLTLATFPKLLDWFAALIGIYAPTNALFALMFFCVIIVLMSLTAIVSKQTERIKKMAQQLALQEKRIRDLEESGMMGPKGRVSGSAACEGKNGELC